MSQTRLIVETMDVNISGGIFEFTQGRRWRRYRHLCTTTTLGTPKLWPLLTGDRCSEVGLCYKNLNWGSKMVVVVGRWLLFGGGCYSEVAVSSGLTVLSKKKHLNDWKIRVFLFSCSSTPFLRLRWKDFENETVTLEPSHKHNFQFPPPT